VSKPRGKAEGRSEQLIETYLDYLASERGLSPNTLSAYHADLQRLRAAIGTRRSLDRVRRQDLLEVLHQMRLDGRSPRSVARWLVAIRGFYGQLVAEEILTEDPTVHLDAPRIWRTLPKVLSFAEVEAVLAAPNRSEPIGLRDQAMLEVLYATGIA